MIWQYLDSLIPVFLVLVTSFSSLHPHFTLTAFTLHTECLLDQCLSCHTDYSLYLTEPEFLRLLPLNSLCVTDSCMMQMHVTCWGFVNCEISLNPYINVSTKRKRLSPWPKTTVQTRNVSSCQSTICTYSSVSFFVRTFLGNVHVFFLCTFLYPFVEHVTTPPPLPSLSALLLLVPLVAATVCVLLWRQKHISDSGESSGVFFSDSFSCSVHLQPLSAATEWCGPWQPLGLL